jgi:hypothetical protein
MELIRIIKTLEVGKETDTQTKYFTVQADLIICKRMNSQIKRPSMTINKELVR